MGFSGMFWFDNQKKRSIVDRVRGAIAGYRNKFGRMPEVCLVSQTQFSELKITEVEGVQVRAYRWCLANHFIVGIDDPRPEPKDPPDEQ